MNIFHQLNIPPVPNEKDIENIDRKKFKENPSNQKYEKFLAEQLRQKANAELKQNKAHRSEWWKANIINIITLIVALATLVATILK